MTLRPLSHYSDSKFDSKKRDLRGYDLFLEGSPSKGGVRDLIVDGNGSVRYADIEHSGKRHLVPIGYVRALPSGERVTLRGLSGEQLHKSPTYDPEKGSIDDSFESKVDAYYDDVDDSDGAYAGPEYRGRGWRTGEDQKVDLMERLDDYKVADHSKDPRGWKVVDALGKKGKKLGEVDHLIGDTRSMKVSFLVIELDDDAFDFNDDKDRHVLIPVGYAELDDNEDHVYLRGIDRATLGTLPAYTDESLTSEVLRRTTAAIRGRRQPERRHEAPRYNDDAISNEEADLRVQRVEEELLVGKRAKKGAVIVEKTVEREKVAGQVSLREDHVEVKRVAPTKRDKGQVAIGKDEIRIPVIKEEMVVAKRPVVKEVLVVKRRRDVDVERVTDTLKKERVKVSRKGVAKDLHA